MIDHESRGGTVRIWNARFSALKPRTLGSWIWGFAVEEFRVQVATI